jgi:hypothetical protein
MSLVVKIMPSERHEIRSIRNCVNSKSRNCLKIERDNGKREKIKSATAQFLIEIYDLERVIQKLKKRKIGERQKEEIFKHVGYVNRRERR